MNDNEYAAVCDDCIKSRLSLHCSLVVSRSPLFAQRKTSYLISTSQIGQKCIICEFIKLINVRRTENTVEVF